MAVFGFVREWGWLDLNWYSFSGTGHLSSAVEGTPAAKAGTPDETDSEQKMAAEILAGLGSASRESGEDSGLQISRLELTGFYLFPLFKKATCTIEAIHSTNDGNESHISGEIHLKAIGLCSVREFKTAAARAIAADIASQP
jgi:hypothetical protein